MRVPARGSEDDGEGEEATSPGGSSPDAADARGFSAQLQGVSLWDLVQMECLARSRMVVQVKGEGGTGYLYFDRGRILHAITADRTGEDAALEILAWTNGSFQPSDRPWPERGTIATSHEALILQAAKLRDEKGRANVVAFPMLEDVELVEIDEEGSGEMPSAKTGGTFANQTGGRAEPGGEFEVVLRIGPNGTLVSNRGGSEDLADTTAYVHRLTQLTGELLGLEEFVALECVFVEGRFIIFTDANGEIVALRPRPEANLQPLRDRLGL